MKKIKLNDLRSQIGVPEGVLNLMVIEGEENDYLFLDNIIKKIGTIESIRIEVDWVRKLSEVMPKLELREYDLCVMNQNFDKQNGLDILKLFYRYEKKMPVIMLVDRYDEQLKLNALEMASVDFVLKDEISPVNLKKSFFNTMRMYKYRLNEQRYLGNLKRKMNLDSFEVLASNIAHEFNNLLTVILGNTEIMQSKLSRTSYHHKYIEAIRSAAEKALDVIDEIKKFGGVGTGDFEDIDIITLIDEVIKEFELSDQHNIKISFNSLQQELFCRCNEMQLKEALRNVIQNSFEAIDHQEGAVNIDLNVIEIDDEMILKNDLININQGKFVAIDIRDDGPGLEMSHLSVFEPFRTTKIKKRGLGLTIAMGVVKAHGGSVRALSYNNEGTLISLYLPFEKDFD